MNRNVFLKGSRIILRPLEVSDIDGNYQFWLNDHEIVYYNSHGRFPETKDSLRKYIESIENSNVKLVLAIVEIEKNQHVGNISLQLINWVDRSAEIAFLLGEKEFWGKGLMLEAGRLLIDHAYRNLNLNRIYCGTSSENIGMQKLAIKLGMIQEGVRRKSHFKNGVYHDLIEYGLLKSEFLPNIN